MKTSAQLRYEHGHRLADALDEYVKEHCQVWDRSDLGQTLRGQAMRLRRLADLDRP